MTVRAGKMNGKNLNYIDQDNSALDYALVNSGIIEGMAVTTNSVAIGRAILNTKRTSVTPNQQFGVHIEITSAETIDTSGTKKVWLALNPTYINDGTLATAPMGTQLATVVTGASYPADSAYYIPLASITAGVITDARVFITGKAILQKGLTANSVKENNATGDEVLKTVGSGSSILSTETLRKKKADGSYEEVTWATFKSDILSGATPNITLIAGEAIGAEKTVHIECKPTEGGVTAIPLGDSATNTRIYTNDISNGVAFTADAFYGYLTGAPTDNITVRIETDNGSGKPSGTLAHANATATVLYTALSASFVQKVTITYAGSVTIAKGTKTHRVFARTAGVSGVNYFNLMHTGETKGFRGFGTYNGTIYSSLTMTPPYIESVGSADNIALLGSNTGIRNNIVGINSVVRASGDEFTQNIGGTDTVTGAVINAGYTPDTSGNILQTMNSVNSLIGTATDRALFKPLTRHIPKNQKQSGSGISIPNYNAANTFLTGFYCDKPGYLGLWAQCISSGNTSSWNIVSGTDGITYGTAVGGGVVTPGSQQVFSYPLVAGRYYQIYVTNGSGTSLGGSANYRANFTSYDRI